MNTKETPDTYQPLSRKNICKVIWHYEQLTLSRLW